jgi:hypothetical protein
LSSAKTTRFLSRVGEDGSDWEEDAYGRSRMMMHGLSGASSVGRDEFLASRTAGRDEKSVGGRDVVRHPS